MHFDFIRVPEICDLRHCGKTKLYELIYQGLWPKPIFLGPKSTVWLRSEVESMLSAVVAGYTNEQTRKLVKDLETKRSKFGVTV